MLHAARHMQRPKWGLIKWDLIISDRGMIEIAAFFSVHSRLTKSAVVAPAAIATSFLCSSTYVLADSASFLIESMLIEDILWGAACGPLNHQKYIYALYQDVNHHVEREEHQMAAGSDLDPMI